MTTQPSHPQTKADLLARIDAEWRLLQGVIANLRPEQLTVPDAGGWTVLDNLAHLTEWERFLLRNQFQGLMPHQAADVDPGLLAPFDIHRFNAHLLERNRRRPAASVFADLQAVHTQLVAAIQQTTDATLSQAITTFEGETLPLIVWCVYNTYEHYREHRLTIEKSLAA